MQKHKIIVNLFRKNNTIQWESYFFWVVVLFTLLPVLATKYFITLDGPSHLYNANLIKELLLGKNQLIKDLFQFNPIPVPNWSGHFIMAFFCWLFPAFIAEKLLLVIYLVFTPLFFRRIVLFIAPENKWATYFIFPFLHNHLLYFGFFNMSLGITFMFIATSYFLKMGDSFSVKKILILCLLLFATFFSHIMLFLITIVLLTLLALAFVDLRKENENYILLNTNKFTNRILTLFIAALPWIILCAFYLFQIDSIEKQPRSDLSGLFKWIIDVRPLLTLCYCSDLIVYTRLLFALFLFLIFTEIYLVIKRQIHFVNGKIAFTLALPSLSFIWLVFACVFLFFFLLIPNAILLSDRLILLFYLFLVGWLALLPRPKWLQYLSVIIILWVHSYFVIYHIKNMKSTSKNVVKIEELAKIIEPDNLVLALNYCDNWLYSHSSGYIGANGAIAVMENYETALPWFPLKWNLQQFNTEPLSHGIFSNRDFACKSFINAPDSSVFSLQQNNRTILPMKYVFQIGNNDKASDDCSMQTKKIIETSYVIIKENDFCKLYSLKE